MTKQVTHEKTRARFLLAAAAAVMLAIALTGEIGHAEEAKPKQILETFMDAFHKFDYPTCRALFAQGAIVTITRRLQGGEFQRHQGDAFEWIDGVSEQVKTLNDWKWKKLESHTIMNTHGATEVLKYLSTAKTPGGSFTNEGTDVAFLVMEDGRWKILQYNMFEDFRWKRDEKASSSE